MISCPQLNIISNSKCRFINKIKTFKVKGLVFNKTMNFVSLFAPLSTDAHARVGLLHSLSQILLVCEEMKV
jgi:hypothetical protein